MHHSMLYILAFLLSITFSLHSDEELIQLRAPSSLSSYDGMPSTIVDDILTTPNSLLKNNYRGRFGNTVEVSSPDGRGIVYDINGNFLFFKE